MKFPFGKGKNDSENAKKVKSKIIALSKFKETPLKRKVLVYITKREADGLHVIRKIKAKEPITQVAWNDHTYLIEPDGVSFYEKGLPVYVFEYENSLPLHFNVDKESLKSEYVYQLFNRQILRQLISSIGKTRALDLMTLIVGAIMGLGIGLAIGMYIAPHPTLVYHTNSTSITTHTTFPFPTK